MRHADVAYGTTRFGRLLPLQHDHGTLSPEVPETRPDGVNGQDRAANGDLAQFGYPLTEEITERLEDGNDYRVQYFERARFEHHPENPDPQYQVLLGQFGRHILNQR